MSKSGSRCEKEIGDQYLDKGEDLFHLGFRQEGLYNYNNILWSFGLAVVLIAYLPKLLNRIKISYTVPILGIDIIIYFIPVL